MARKSKSFPATASPSPMDDYETGQDVQALQRAEEVKSDPKRHAKAKKHAAKQLKEHVQKGKALAKIAKQSQQADQDFDQGDWDVPKG